MVPDGIEPPIFRTSRSERSTFKLWHRDRLKLMRRPYNKTLLRELSHSYFSSIRYPSFPFPLTFFRINDALFLIERIEAAVDRNFLVIGLFVVRVIDLLLALSHRPHDLDRVVERGHDLRIHVVEYRTDA
jgi:hypothetical protein